MATAERDLSHSQSFLQYNSPNQVRQVNAAVCACTSLTATYLDCTVRAIVFYRDKEGDLTPGSLSLLLSLLRSLFLNLYPRLE